MLSLPASVHLCKNKDTEHERIYNKRSNIVDIILFSIWLKLNCNVLWGIIQCSLDSARRWPEFAIFQVNSSADELHLFNFQHLIAHLSYLGLNTSECLGKWDPWLPSRAMKAVNTHSRRLSFFHSYSGITLPGGTIYKRNSDSNTCSGTKIHFPQIPILIKATLFEENETYTVTIIGCYLIIINYSFWYSFTTVLCRYDGPFMIPDYGLAQFPQAFCRVAAVQGAIYVLRCQIHSLRYSQDEEICTGVRLCSGQVW